MEAKRAARAGLPGFEMGERGGIGELRISGGGCEVVADVTKFAGVVEVREKDEGRMQNAEKEQSLEFMKFFAFSF